MKIEILYEDKDILVINKPSGLMVHGDGRSEEKTLTDWILEKYPKMKNVGEPLHVSRGKPGQSSKDDRFTSSVVERPGIVHRLDKETSGALILAKNQKSFEFLKNQFKEREMQKTYLTLVWGIVKKDSGVIEAPIARSKNDFRQWSAQKGKRGQEREAVTEYKVLKRFQCQGEALTLLEVSPKTGRTHQIRVHMKYINHPVVCDRLYAPSKPCPVLNLDRLALHAKSIEFALNTGKRILVEAPLPSDIAKAMSL